MVNQTFESIFNGKSFYIDVKTIESILQNMGYKMGSSPTGIDAIKWVNRHRYHFKIDQLPDGGIDKFCYIDLHKDNGAGLYHTSISSDYEIRREFKIFINELFRVFYKRKDNQKKRERNQKRLKYKTEREWIFRWM